MTQHAAEWAAYVDGYCERLAPGLLGEPFNTISNVGFLLAAVAVWRQSRGEAGPRVLAAGLALIFVASTAFHMLATRWAGTVDSAAIALFVLAYAVVFAHVFLRAPWRWAWLAVPAFLALAVPVVAGADALGLPGAQYAAPLVAPFVLAALTARDAVWPALLTAGGLFGLSLTFRSVDHTVCGSFPPGTHFLWHLLNAAVLYLVTRTAVGRWVGSPERADPSTAGR
ncbi:MULTISPECIES: hypothetical protein [Prauserella salsuginis group]|uniref:Ceramidase n=1 Tax=Prauserella salsuginis TaxID=387889 RepID=A0ABW6FX91_9PSEU|nr:MULTISPECIES: hypothetical protein [Prauserella salsuginis group]MCR3720870.1 hypothetical protein [Prauserella flava]MCR3735049.1 hypothetical protein [Prauserella salsuginis]